MPAAADSGLRLSLTPAPPASTARGGRQPLHAADDHAVVAELLGDAAAAALVAAVPVARLRATPLR